MKQKFAFQWHITDKCDQRCLHCYIDHKQQKTMNIANCFKVIEKIQAFCKDLKRDPLIVIAGGDPILHPHFDQLLVKIKELAIPFSILGNPFHLTDETIEKLKDAGCLNYQMSLDGLQETHDKIRKPGSFVATVNAIRLLVKHGMKVSIMSTVSSMNYKEIPELMNFLFEKTKVNSFAFARYCPKDKEDAEKNNVTPFEYRELLSKIWDILQTDKQKEKRFFFKDHLWKLFFYELGLLKIEKTKIIASGCNCAFNHLTILPDGDLYACRRFESKIGNVFYNNLVNAFLFKDAKYRKIHNLEQCAQCELLNYCRGCPAVSSGTYGSFFKKDPQCWKVVI